MAEFPVNALPAVIIMLFFISMAGCIDTQSASPTPSPGAGPANAWKMDHAVIVVSNLTASMEKFRAAGFNVVLGGEHADDDTHNALVPFRDGSYLELFAPVDPKLAVEMKGLLASGNFDTAMAGEDAIQKRFMFHLAEGTGLKDFALSRSGLNLTEEQVLARRGGFVLEGPTPMSRTRPDGVLVAWHVDVPVSPYSASMPFFIVDDTPRSFRVPDGNMTSHPNDVAGIKGIEVATQDPVTVTRWYDTLLSTSPKSRSDTLAAYALDGSVITVRGIANNETEGPVGIVLYKDNGDTLSLQDLPFE